MLIPKEDLESRITRALETDFNSIIQKIYGEHLERAVELNDDPEFYLDLSDDEMYEIFETQYRGIDYFASQYMKLQQLVYELNDKLSSDVSQILLADNVDLFSENNELHEELQRARERIMSLQNDVDYYKDALEEVKIHNSEVESELDYYKDEYMDECESAMGKHYCTKEDLMVEVDRDYFEMLKTYFLNREV
jgi:chromosome segregation ATPase